MSNQEISYADAADKVLLGLYHRKRDQDAFAELVRRYSSMVAGVARRMVGCPHAAEDVLQATFLVLSKDARRIRRPEALASWLYGVAFRISARQVKRRARQGVSMLKDEVMVSDDPLQKLSEQFEHQAAFEELNRLPEKVRAPMVLRYLQGKSNSEVAESLSVSESAVEGRLKRGRNQLRLRLARQGVTFAAAIAVLEQTIDHANAAEREELVAKTVEACFANGVGTDPFGIEVTQLANEEVFKMTMTSVVKGAAVACLAFGIVATGWSVVGTMELRAQDKASNDVVLQNNVESNSPSAAGAKISAPTRKYYYGYAGQGSMGSSTSPPTQVPKNGRYSVEDEITASEQRILTAMQQSTTVEFHEETLANVIQVLKEDHQIQIIIDENGLAAEGVTSSDAIVSCDLSNIKLKSALNHILGTHRLGAMIKDEVLVITSREEVERHTVPRVYKSNRNWKLAGDDLINVITTTIAPHSWQEVGGPGSIVSVDGGLVISASSDVHEKINDLFRQIDRIAR